MIWSALIIPLFSVAFLFKVFGIKDWRIYIWLFAVNALLIFGFEQLLIGVQAWDKEFWTGYVTEARYYEDWNEKVSCRHPIYCTQCSGSGNDRSCHQYVCGYYHPYDVDYHGEYWEAHDNNGFTLGVSKAYFDWAVKTWGNKSFVDMHRDYHTNDGDMYRTFYNEKDKDMDIVNWEFNYKNVVAATNNVFKYEEVTPQDFKEFGLLEYPKIKKYDQVSILGYKDADAEWLMQVLNARLGKPKKVKVFILVYKEKGISSSTMQEAYWRGGNKNELILTIGMDKEDKVVWGRTFSWTDKKLSVVESTELITKQIGSKIDLKKIATELKPIVSEKFIKKSFKDFSYIQVQPTDTGIISTLVSLVILNGLAVFGIKNNYSV